jgi:hypothetical protein
MQLIPMVVNQLSFVTLAASKVKLRAIRMLHAWLNTSNPTPDHPCSINGFAISSMPPLGATSMTAVPLHTCSIGGPARAHAGWDAAILAMLMPRQQPTQAALTMSPRNLVSSVTRRGSSGSACSVRTRQISAYAHFLTAGRDVHDVCMPLSPP